MDDLNPSPFHMHRLYFKGFVNEEKRRFGVAICDQEDNLLFHVKGSRHHDDFPITDLEAELKALKRGLTEAVDLGINHVSFYCDHDQIFELVMGIATPEQDNIALLMDDVQDIRQIFASSTPVLMTRNQAKFAYKLAMETIVSKASIDRPEERKTCGICFNDDFKADDMFSVSLCGHQFCVECMKQHIEVRLLEGSTRRCPHYQCRHYHCKSKLILESCANILTPELREMWERRNEKETVRVAGKVYCPNPRCSALEPKTGDQVRRCCSKYRKYFCINCKVPWHKKKSCQEYKMLCPNPKTTKMLRKCRKCQYMMKLQNNRVNVVICRCGYMFCYTCGADWKQGDCPHRQMWFVEGLGPVGSVGLVGIVMLAALVVFLNYRKTKQNKTKRLVAAFMVSSSSPLWWF